MPRQGFKSLREHDDKSMSESKPESPAERRPGGTPYYIDEYCPDCGKTLVYLHVIANDTLDEEKAFVGPEYMPECRIWDPLYDEFVCPECLDGIHMDWPPAEKANFEKRVSEAAQDIEEGNTASLEDITDALNLSEDD